MKFDQFLAARSTQKLVEIHNNQMAGNIRILEIDIIVPHLLMFYQHSSFYPQYAIHKPDQCPDQTELVR